MQKVILDTNIIVSSMIGEGASRKIVRELFLQDKIQICISTDVLNEYIEVLKKLRLQKSADFKISSEVLLNMCLLLARMYEIDERFKIIKDFSDNKFLDLAFISQADFIITGNKNGFIFNSFYTTKIVSPIEYWEKYSPLRP